jgi:phosphoribosyl 1,2-cyclic phosphate phosphodiesterase
MPRRITPGVIEAGAGLEVFGLRCTPIPLMHGKLPILGYRLEAGPGVEDAGGLLPLAYCTDASGVPPESWGRLAGVRTLVLDALRHRSHPTHLTVSQAVGIAERVGAGRTYFVHMSHDLGHEETERGLPGGMRLAWDGLTLP